MDYSNSRSIRAALRENSQLVRQAREEGAIKRQSYDRAQDQDEHAQALVREADDALVDFDRKEAQAIGQSWPPRSPSPKEREARRALEETLASRKRTLAVVQQKADAARVPAEEAAAVVNKLASETIPLAIAVLAEEGNVALAELVSARADAAKAEGTVRSIAAALVERRAFREAEVINVTVNATPWPEPSVDAAPYLKLLDRLAADPDSEVCK
jgi:hypothetical protein